MRVRKVLVRGSVALTAGALVTAGVLYLLASRVPGRYRPANLDRSSREAATGRFYRRLMDFSNRGQENRPFEWSVSQEDLNDWLSATEEIAVRQGARPGSVYQAMSDAGLSGPAVWIGDGEITLMVRSTVHEKVLSVDLRPAITPEGLLSVRLTGARIGSMPISTGRAVGRLTEAAGALRARSGADDEPNALGEDDRPLAERLPEALGRVLTSLDAPGVPAEITWKLSSRKRVRITRIDLADGRLTLHVVPALAASGGR